METLFKHNNSTGWDNRALVFVTKIERSPLGKENDLIHVEWLSHPQKGTKDLWSNIRRNNLANAFTTGNSIAQWKLLEGNKK
ncbi:MAG: hypothetical protein Q8P81_03555 [Nanoarchaeota archaeon]|nr:hypothetical protein [Nanoarchaeota archaeon]